MIKPISLFILAIIIQAAAIAQRDTISLEKDWQFAIDTSKLSVSDIKFRQTLRGFDRINLPHTWNTAEKTQNHYGWGWYLKKMKIPSSWKNRNVVLEFDAVNH